MSRLYEINTVSWLYELGQRAGRTVRLEDVPASEWDELKALGFDSVWLMGVWKRSRKGQEIFRATDEYREFSARFDRLVPGWTEADLTGSPYSIAGYKPDPLIAAGPEGLAAARAELNRRGMKLILDFVPNHTAPDHPWATEHPEYYVSGTLMDYNNDPHAYTPTKAAGGGTLYLARGRDPYFPPWSDTLQLNYRNPATRAAMVGQLISLASVCDGLRCDMAMLVLNDIFGRTWSGRAECPGCGFGPEFWSEAREAVPGLTLIAEAYWGLEERLLHLGFDYVYDKELYDMMRAADAEGVRRHLERFAAGQSRAVRFIENHDEPRAAEAFSHGRIKAAAVLFSTLPGMKLYHQGQFEGAVVKLPVQLRRVAPVAMDEEAAKLNKRVLQITGQSSFYEGQWRLRHVSGAFDETHRSLVAYTWSGPGPAALKLVVVNLGFGMAQGRVRIEDLFNGNNFILTDDIDGSVYKRSAAELKGEGLHIILPAHGAHILDFKAV